MIPTPRGSRVARDAIVTLVRSGRATSRADIARITGLSPTTVAARVGELMSQGYLQEGTAAPSRGGRPPRMLQMRPGAGTVVSIALGERHAAIGLYDAAGEEVTQHREPIDIADGPEVVLRLVAERVKSMDDEHPTGGPLLAACIGIPGPVSSHSGRVVAPARMPGWNGTDVQELIRPYLGVPVVVENDANLMTLGEHAVSDDPVDDMVFIKVGSGIGSGIIARGVLHKGAHGFAGDISHVPVPDAPSVPCSCGRVGCLDAVASGSALVHALAESGIQVRTTDDLLVLARDAHPQTTQILRAAGLNTGLVLATIVNFFNPARLVVGGNLSRADAFVAGLRSALYTQCPPMITDGLHIVVSRTGQHAAVTGGAQAALDHAFSGSRDACEALDDSRDPVAEGRTRPRPASPTPPTAPGSGTRTPPASTPPPSSPGRPAGRSRTPPATPGSAF
ncbi:ROK family transcriptional regulator [Kineococcus sp. TBRC 1896]|uniref:ROK family transcriptional regulator n=1 Tax=Kineococcus mangrovi TaxID=1660183 RepID=A0ABV4I362_9ACTN